MMIMNHSLMRKKQHGSALLVSLVILLILTLISITSMKSSILEVKMMDNFYNRTLSDEGAETALRAAEQWLAIQDINEPQPYQAWGKQVVNNKVVTDVIEIPGIPPAAIPGYCGACVYATQPWTWFQTNYDVNGNPVANVNSDAANVEGYHMTLSANINTATITRGGTADMANQPIYILAYNGFDTPNSNGNVRVLDPALRVKHIGPHYYTTVAAAQDASGVAHSVRQGTVVIEN